MIEIRCFCDMCAERITEDRTQMVLKCGPFRAQRPEIDLCSECAPKVWALLDDRPAGCVAPTPRVKKASA